MQANDDSLNMPGSIAANVPPAAPSNGAEQNEAATQPGSRPSIASPLQASDAELIEEPWIRAVQNALAVNASDPHAMSDAIAALRGEYLQRRYGKSSQPDRK